MNQNFILSSIPLTELESAIAKTVEQLLDKRQQLTPVHEPEELITREETAKILRISLPTLHEWTKRGIVPHYKVATRVRYKRNEVMNLFQSGEVNKYGRR